MYFTQKNFSHKKTGPKKFIKKLGHKKNMGLNLNPKKSGGRKLAERMKIQNSYSKKCFYFFL